MYKEVTETEFKDGLKEYYSMPALETLWTYFTDYEDDTEEKIKFDIPVIISDYIEYSNLDEFLKNYDGDEEINSLDDLERLTFLIRIEGTEAFLINPF